MRKLLKGNQIFNIFMMYMRMKDLLLESADTLILNGKYYPFRTKYNVVTGLVYNDGLTGKNGAYVGCSSVNGTLLVDTGKNEMDNKLRDLMAPFLKLFIDDGYVVKGHSDLEDVLYRYDGYLDSTIRFRVYFVEGKYYFTFWGSDIDSLKKNRGIFDRIIRDSGIETKDVVFEIRQRDVSKSGYMEFVEYANAFDSSDGEGVKVEGEIEKRIKELNSRLAELIADEHVRGAIWTIGEKKKYKLEVKNLELAAEALRGALRAGETDLSKVIIKTVDKLEDELEVVPSSVLYAKLEKELKQYGTSAVAIMQKLRGMGINPRDVIREIADRCGGVISTGRLMEELSDYVEIAKRLIAALMIMARKYPRNFTGAEKMITPGVVQDVLIRLGHTHPEIRDKLSSLAALARKNRNSNMINESPDKLILKGKKLTCHDGITFFAFKTPGGKTHIAISHGATSDFHMQINEIDLSDYVERGVCTIYMTKKLGGGMLMIWQGDVIDKETSGAADVIIKDKGEIDGILAELTDVEVKMLKDGNPVVVSNLSGGIGKMNESTGMVKYDDIEKLSKSVKTFEGFLASFVGKRLKDLLDGLSFSRLYVMNKYDDMRGDNPQQLVTMLMDTTVAYINFKLISPIRKQLDDVDVLDKQTDEYKEYHRNRMGIVKQILVASRSGDKEKEVELRSRLSLLKDPSSYSNNMKDMDILVKEIHGRPLTLKDVMPSDSDSEDDKKRYKSAVEAFDNFKNRMLSESDKTVKTDKFKESLRKLVKEVMGGGGKYPKDPYYSPTDSADKFDKRGGVGKLLGNSVEVDVTVNGVKYKVTYDTKSVPYNPSFGENWKDIDITRIRLSGKDILGDLDMGVRKSITLELADLIG